MTPLRILFLGSDPIALPALEWLAGEGSGIGRVIAAITQPDRATGRGQKVVPNAIKRWAESLRIPSLQPEKLTEDVRQTVAALAPDVALVMAYGHILREDFIATPRLGTLNLHTSVLPAYRGASPIQTAVANGESETGVTLMRIVRQLDAGPVADVERVPIGPLDTALDVEGKLARACVPLLARTLPRLADGTLTFAGQDHARATFCRKLAKDDGVLDFGQPASVLAARVNGLFPWPSCRVEFQGQALRLGQADAVPGQAEAGCVAGSDAEGLLIGTGRHILRVRQLQRPGGRMLPAGEFLRGVPVPAGTQFLSVPHPPLVSPAPFRH